MKSFQQLLRNIVTSENSPARDLLGSTPCTGDFRLPDSLTSPVQSNLGRVASQSPCWLQWDASNLPQNCPFPSTMTTTSNTPIHRQTPLTIPNGIRIHSAVLPRYTFRTERQTDRQTDRPTRHSHRPTDGLGDVVRNMIVYALIELERRANNAS